MTTIKCATAIAMTLGLFCGAAQADATPKPWRDAVTSFAAEHFKNPAWGFSHSQRDYRLARELAEVGLTADLAVARHDWECIYSASERLLELQRSWAALYRRLLVVGVQASPVVERSSV